VSPLRFRRSLWGSSLLQDRECVSDEEALLSEYTVNHHLPQFAILFGFFSGAFFALLSPILIATADDIDEIG
jgi:hypothetical protein